MASKLSELYPAGCVVWYKLQGWPWWPSKVEDVIQPEGEEEAILICCFKTGDEYELSESPKSHAALKCFVHEGVEDLVTKEKKSYYKKKLTYKDYCEALELAVEYTREQTGDPEFSLGIDPYADVVSMNQKKATPNQSDKSRTPRTSSQAKRSGVRASTGGRTARKRPATTPSSFSTSKKSRNGHVIDAVAASPTLADAPEDTSEDIKSSKRKRSRDSLSAEGEVREAAVEAKRQRTNTNERLSGEKEERVGESGKEPVPRKLNFNEGKLVDNVHTKEGPSDSKEGGVSDSIQDGVSDSKQKGVSDSRLGGPSDSSPVAEAKHQPSSPCGGSLSNGHTSASSLPSLGSVEGSQHAPVKGESVEPLGGDKEGKRCVAEATEKGEAGGLPYSNKRTEDGDDVMSEDDVSGEGGGFSDSDDDDSMPTFSCKVKEDLTLKQLRPNAIIWVKHSSKFPFWPALVVKVDKNRQTRGCVYVARVLFFGYNETQTTAVRNKKKIAPFATKRNKEFMEEGTNSQYKTEFEQAVDEAKTCLEYRLKSDETTSTPRKLFDQVAKLRPKEYIKRRYECPMWSASKEDINSARRRDEDAASEGGGSDQDEFLTGKHRLPFSEDNDEETNLDLFNSDDEEEDPVYSYDRVMNEVDQLRSVLVDITQGKLLSEFQRKMLEGSKKERSQLKVAPKAGPLAKWSTSKRTNLVEKLVKISEEASDGKLTISHAYDVLLPEFTIRLMMKLENLTESEALERLDHNK